MKPKPLSLIIFLIVPYTGNPPPSLPSACLELRPSRTYVKRDAGRHAMLKAVTLKEIERIFSVTDALGISREALVIPLRTEAPGRMALMKDGKLEIVVDRDGDFEDWLTRLEPAIRSLMDLPDTD